MREVGDPDPGGVLGLAGHPRGDEPAVALLERRACGPEEPVGRGSRNGVETALVAGERRREEVEDSGHAFSRSPAGSKNGPEVDVHRHGPPVDLDDEPGALGRELVRDDREPDDLGRAQRSAGRR